MSPATPHTRELAARDSNGIHVVLLWHPDENALTVFVDDTRAGERFQVAVAPDRGLDTFYHPFAYATRRREEQRSTHRPACQPTRSEAAPTGAGH